MDGYICHGAPWRLCGVPVVSLCNHPSSQYAAPGRSLTIAAFLSSHYSAKPTDKIRRGARLVMQKYLYLPQIHLWTMKLKNKDSPSCLPLHVPQRPSEAPHKHF
ncbi:hypothetical protein E2C01_033738 [Portunus trituberculatus]|uniref:Uncharacterized protein n=1 Tax=Portunus trituberculatus TaxID=210409 RepID=A0A5B7F0W9_PORTR|nr:hypothetical protein [Portunus trituberculatus]